MYSPPQGRVSGFSCETRNAIPTASGRRSVLNGTEVRPTWSAFLPDVAFPEEIRRLKGISLRGTRRSEFLSCSKAGGRTGRNLLSVPTQYLVQFLLWGHSKLKIPKTQHVGSNTEIWDLQSSNRPSEPAYFGEASRRWPSSWFRSKRPSGRCIPKSVSSLDPARFFDFLFPCQSELGSVVGRSE